jgi:hypothetical protein
MLVMHQEATIGCHDHINTSVVRYNVQKSKYQFYTYCNY